MRPHVEIIAGREMYERHVFLAIFIFYFALFKYYKKLFSDAKLFIEEKVKSKRLRSLLLLMLYATSFLSIPFGVD